MALPSTRVSSRSGVETGIGEHDLRIDPEGGFHDIGSIDDGHADKASAFALAAASCGSKLFSAAVSGRSLVPLVPASRKARCTWGRPGPWSYACFPSAICFYFKLIDALDQELLVLRFPFPVGADHTGDNVYDP